MLRLAVGMARRGIASLVAVAFAVLGGTAIVTGTGVLFESGLRSELPAGRLAGADILVSAPQTLPTVDDLDLALPERAPVPAGLVRDLADVPGVTAVAGDLSFPAAVLDGADAVARAGDAAIDGHGWSSVTLLPRAVVDGAPPSAADEVALDADLAATAGLGIGDTASLVAAGVRGEYRVTAVVEPAGAGVLFDDATAAELAGRAEGARAATVDLVGLRVEAGAVDRVADAVRAERGDSGLVVSTGDDRGDVLLPETAASRSGLVSLASALAGVPLMVVGFLIAGAVSVSIAGQRRELALLRAVGTTPRQLRRLVAAQATAIGAVAALPGLLLGYLLADRFGALLVNIGLIPEALSLTVSPLPAVAAVLLMLLVVQVAARRAAWRVSREPVTTVLGESRTGPRTPSAARTIAGMLLLVAAIPLAVQPLNDRSAVGAAMTSLAGIVAAIGLSLVGPALLRRVSGGLAARLPARASATTWLATANLHGYAMRSAGAISTLAMAVAFVLTYAFPQTTVAAAVARDVGTATLSDATIDASAVGGVPDGLLEEVRATEGVRAAAPMSTTTVLLPVRTLGEGVSEAFSALVLSPVAPDALDLGVRSGDLTGLTGPTVAIGREFSETGGAAVGDDVALTLGDGTDVEARVVAIYDRDLGFGPLVLSTDLVSGHRGSDLADGLLVRTDGTAGASERLAALPADWPGIAVAAGDGDTGIAPATPPEVWVNLAVIVVLLGYVLLGITNAMVAGTAQRRTEFAALRLTGTTPQQVRSMVRREAVLISTAAVVAGLLLSAVPLALLGEGFLGRPWPAGPWWLLPGTVVVVAAVAFLSTEGPTRLALRTAPAETFRRAG